MQWLLVVFGLVFDAVMLAAILVPYFRGRRDLLTSWNLFLLGSMQFIGNASIQSGLVENHLYGNCTDGDYVRFVLGGVVFYAVAMMTYAWIKLPGRLAGRHFRKWVKPSTGALLLLTGLCVVFVIFRFIAPEVQFIFQMSFLGLYGTTFAMVFTFGAWYRHPRNPILLTIFAVTVVAAFLVTLAASYSRRDYLNFGLALAIGAYWLRWRYLKPSRLLIPMSVTVTLLFVILGGVSAIRASGRESGPFFVNLLNQAEAVFTSYGKEGSALSDLVSADTTEASLVAINFYYTERHESHPFHTLIYVLTNPIPRAWYPEKVGSLGEALPRDTGWVASYGYVSWGVGIVGHGYYEGGVHMLAFYGFLVACGFKFFDELLVRRADNVVLPAILAAVSGQIIGLPRGEFGLFIVLILGGCTMGYVLNLVGRMFFGTVVYPADSELEHAAPQGADAEFQLVGDA